MLIVKVNYWNRKDEVWKDLKQFKMHIIKKADQQSTLVAE